MLYTYEAEIGQLEGKIKWSVVYFPYVVSEVFGTNGRVQVVITVDGHEFEHTLLPSKNGHYFVYNKLISREVGKERGDTVKVTVKKQEGERTLVVPDYIRSMLEDSKTLDIFENQPTYMKREQINYIEVAKKEETRVARTEKLIGRLKER